MLSWIRWATEYTVGAAVVLAYLARSGQYWRERTLTIEFDEDRPRRRAPRLLN